MKFYGLLRLILLSLSGLVIAVACSTKTGGNLRTTIAVSIPPQKAILEEIAGDSVAIVTLLRADSNPETFEPTVSDMKVINSADAWMTIGNLPFEAALIARIGDAGKMEGKLHNISRGIDVIYGTHEHHDEADHNHAHDELAPDPHVWTSIPNMKTMAENMLAVLDSIDPANYDYYLQNYSKLVSRLDSIDTIYRNALAPHRGEAFLIWHPSLSYFARDYDLYQISLGLENKEMSARSLGDNIAKAADANVKTLFIQKNFDAAQADNLARQLGIKTVAINPLDADWLTQLNIVVDAISDNQP